MAVKSKYGIRNWDVFPVYILYRGEQSLVLRGAAATRHFNQAGRMEFYVLVCEMS